MPLLWKPWRRRKQDKRNQRPVVSSSTSGSASSSIELPPALQEVEDEEDGERSPDIVFAAVIQDFNRSAYDEMSVRRGQMIQPLYNDGMWLYVRDIDGHCGYIPANFCSPLDEMKNVHWKTEDPGRASRKVKPRHRSIHDLVRPALHSYSSNHDSLPSTPAANYLSSLQSPPQNNRTANTSLTGSQVSAELFSRQEVISRARERTQPPTTSINSPVPQQMLHPLHPLTFSQRRELTSEVQRRTSTEDTDRPQHQHNLHVTKVHGRSNSYQEAVVSTDVNTNRNGIVATPPQIMIRRPSRPSHLPLCRNHHPYDHLESYRLDTQLTTTEGLPTSSRDSQCPDDDVFLPTANKPQGIFRVLENYHRNVQGEVTVKKNEYVIVMGLGVGEWAGVITSSGTEGVIPKIILQRYTPHNMLCSVSTQTELMIVAPAVFSVGTDSSAADNTQSTQRDVVTIREVSLTYRQRRRRRRQSQPRQPTATQTNTLPNPSSSSLPRQSHLQPQAWGSNDGQLGKVSSRR